MSLVNQNIIAGAGAQNAYQISRSVRLRSSASAFFSRTPASAGNRRTWTWSGWVKRGALGSIQTFFSSISSAGVSTEFDLYFATNNTLQIGYGSANWRETNAVYRDTSAWYHIVLAVDTTQASDSNRILLYVNGVSQTFAVSNAVTQNTDTAVNMTYTHRIGGAPSYFGDMYMADINFIDGQALTPAAFGETDAITGVWKPKKYTGTYGTNGFFLNFSDPSAATAAAIGKDYSGNGNNWTPNNISVTAGATYDSMLDVPTPWADGGNGRGNYAVLNPLAVSASTATMSNGNLTATGLVAGGGNAFATIALPSSGKFYWEITPTSLSGDGMIGVGTISATSSYFWQNTDGSLAYYSANGSRYLNNAAVAYGATYAANDVIGVAADIDAGTVTFYKNNVSQGAITFNAAGLFPALADGSGSFASNFNANFGQRPFAYTPPTGFRALNTQNLPEPTIVRGSRFMDVSLYSGNSSSQTVTNAGGFQPDLVWIKSRNVSGNNHNLWDSARGAGQALFSNLTNAESTSANMTGFTSSGFSFSGAAFDSNTTGNNLVAWQWREGATQGFDIVTYTGNGVAGRTVAHNLGVAPRMMIVKRRDAAAFWPVYHASAQITPATGQAYLNTTNAYFAEATTWNNTAPTSAVFTVGTNAETNANTGTYVAYLFSEVAGFSRFGSYTGNGSTDGPFVFCGFRPRYVMVKRTDSSPFNWIVLDTARSQNNVAQAILYPNIANAEDTITLLDFTSNGFKIRTSDTGVNASGGTYIFAAFAENPFKYSLAR